MRIAQAVPPEHGSTPLISPGDGATDPDETSEPDDAIRRSDVFLTDLLVDTGADRCDQATIIDVPVGPPGTPSMVSTIGDSAGATGPDCSFRVDRGWWEAFHINRCARVTIDFCDSEMFHASAPLFLAGTCNPGGSCDPVFSAVVSSREVCLTSGEQCGGRRECFEPNVWIDFGVIPAGTYYFSVLRDLSEHITHAPYRLNITAEECEGECPECRGACCNSLERVCEADVHQVDCPVSASGAGETGFQWFHRATCCQIECRPEELDFDALGVELLGRVPLEAFPSASTLANDVWGYVAPSGREYAILGLSLGTGFVEITDPRNPVIVADIPDAPSIWSDMAVYGEYAYNVNENRTQPTGMQIIDLTKIDEGIVTLLGQASGGLISAHNVFINPVSGFAYPCASNVTRGFIAYDLSDPTDPVPVGQWDEALAHDIYVQSYEKCPHAGAGGRPCEIAFVFAGGDGVKIVDVTEKSNMFTIATHVYPTLAFCHQGWLTDDRRYLIFGDEFDESAFDLPATTYVIDVQDPANPQEVTTFTGGLCVIDHNLHIRGDLVFQANYEAGLQAFDISNIPYAVMTGHFDTRPEGNNRSFNGAWGVFAGFPSGVVVLSDRQRGLFIFSLCGTRPRPGIDGDGQTILRDAAALQNCFAPGRFNRDCLPADLDCNREVNLADLRALISGIQAP